MDEQKPSRNEDEYFVKQDADLIKAQRHKLDSERRKAERASHYMRCPKCGATLIEKEVAEFENRLAELSAEMARPEVARDITKLVKLNDEYEKAQSRLSELMEEWERAEVTR